MAKQALHSSRLGSNSFEAALQAALAQGEVTTELQERFEDKVVHVAHWVEIIVVAAILYLMVMKPF
ncbi:MAG: hypothetical protein HYR94_10220 [Chloroflexi bacterium]|nr:hypothetical protein [Chloroflexota bacterium]